MSKKYGNSSRTTDRFILESNIIHNNFYDYSKSIYINNKCKLLKRVYNSMAECDSHTVEVVGSSPTTLTN